MIKYIWL